MIEWKKYLQDVNEVSITIGKDIYRIKNDVVTHFSNDNTMLEKRKIEIDEFKNIIYGLLPYLYDWEKSYLGQGLVEGANWSVLIKADNHEMKRFSGNNNYPNDLGTFLQFIGICSREKQYKIFRQYLYKIIDLFGFCDRTGRKSNIK